MTVSVPLATATNGYCIEATKPRERAGPRFGGRSSTKSQPPAARTATLGLVAIRATSGYDLVAYADRSIAYFWSIPRSQLYRELARLERLGLIAGTHVPQRSAPDKRVFEITEEGRAVLEAWLESPALPTAPSRNGFSRCS